MGTTRHTHGTPGRVVDRIHGARDSGGRQALVSANPVGLSQRRSGELESAAIRRALSQRRAVGVISRERRTWGSGNPRTRQPAGGLGRTTASGGYLPRSAGMRARGQWTRGTCGDPAELPCRLAVGYGGNNEQQLPCRGTNRQEQNKNFSKNRKQNEVKGRRLRIGLVFCQGAHTREEQEHADEDINSNNSL